jgi:hypothetical protein
MRIDGSDIVAIILASTFGIGIILLIIFGALGFLQ